MRLRFAFGKAGLRVEKVLRSVDEPNEVFILFQATDIDKARSFVISPDVPEAQQQSGAVETQIYTFSPDGVG